MLFKKYLIKYALLSSVLGVILWWGLSTSEFASISKACACASQSTSIPRELSIIDFLIQEHANRHKGLFPTYDELKKMLAIELGIDISQKLTAQVDLKSRNFKFIPTKQDDGKIGYAVSNDRRYYALVGIGKVYKLKKIYFWGLEIKKDYVGDEFTVFHPNKKSL
ncbi:hypothetical protein F7734_39600 [Scytonema sp. UIC 10036]|uniref:hypothetical protein n=1 Tax=Scytonema sp. UIC 10036 TaxID=2304196 RepID=UPI0012DA3B26|nr:hypothetical protein [Scytonema sp. UIC 10036]MUG98089.1 hypothetical protein [Scytonema sp. UIC 10036]